MMDELDWEDIESRLYSQVYHASVEKEQLTAPFRSNTDTGTDISLIRPHAARSVMKHSRYFNTERESVKQPVYIPLENEQVTTTPENIYSSVENNVSLKPDSTGLNTEGHLVSQFQNNITVNQYTIPVIINSDLHESSRKADSTFFTSWPLQGQNVLDKKSRKRNKKKTKHKEVKQTDKRDMFSSVTVEVNFNESLQSLNEVICISDDSSSECVLQSMEVNTGFPKKYIEGEKGSKKPESDDDIIYIAPPPIEVINVDVEDAEHIQDASNVEEKWKQELQKVGEEINYHRSLLKAPISPIRLSPNKTNYNPRERRQVLCTPEPSGSNDFLESTSIEGNKFNFGLHGSEFNNSQGDFVRPANPVDFCETGSSSCSTNDCNRDISNSVKTVVFDEVEFPREDIFSEKNLESFSTYIMPKRNPNQKSKTSATNSGTSTPNDLDSTSSDSSSESDYEQSGNVTPGVESSKKLPYLSPMQFDDATTPKKKSKIKTASNFFQNQKRRKSPLRTATGSSKRKSDIIEVSETDSSNTDDIEPVDKKRQPRKKQKMSKRLEERVNVEKKKKGVAPSETVVVNSSSQKKKKKKEKHVKSDSDYSRSENKNRQGSESEPTGNETISIISQWTKTRNSSEFKRTKRDENPATSSDVLEKKKNKSCSESKSSNDESISDRSERKKKKNSSGSKAVSNESNIVEVVLEATTKKKKKNSVSETTQSSKPAEISVTEKPKKKKTVSSENSENEDRLAEKHQKRRKNSCSTSSNRSQNQQEMSEVDDEIIDVVTVEHADEEIDKNCNKSDDLQSDENLNLSQPKEAPTREQNKDETSDENALVDISVISTEEIPSGKSISVSNETKTSAVQETEGNSSDEEIVVDDEPDFNMSNLIVVDEVNSTLPNNEESEIQVLLSSDSECDFSELGDVGKDLRLANCTVKVSKAKVTQAPIAVVGNSGNSAGHYTSKKDCNFDIEAIQRSQSDDPEMWKVSHKDRDIGLNIGQFKARRCNRCRHFGHIALKCTEKIDGPKCSLCGYFGHLEPRCPNKICRRCGNKGDFSTFCWQCFRLRNAVCQTCNMEGHVADMCPDLWRRYHLTTEEGPIVVSQKPQLKPRDQQWCSGCAKNGHLEHECNYYNREYPPLNPYVVSYEDVLPQSNEASLLPTVTDNPENSQAQNTPPNVPPNPIPPLMSLNISLPAEQNQNDRIVVHSGTNCIIEVPNRAEGSTKALNQVSGSDSSGKHLVLEQMMQNYVNEGKPNNQGGCQFIDPQKLKAGTKEMCKKDERRIKHMIMSMPSHAVRQFLKREMSDLEDVGAQSDPKYLKKKIFKCDGLVRSKKPLRYEDLREKCFWFRVLNMFIFGVHKFRDGNLHVNYLRKYLAESKQNKLDVHRRRSLFNSYSYIFGIDRHVNVNYHKVIQQIIQRYDGGGFKKPTYNVSGLFASKLRA